jgi:hypothetical protein
MQSRFCARKVDSDALPDGVPKGAKRNDRGTGSLVVRGCGAALPPETQHHQERIVSHAVYVLRPTGCGYSYVRQRDQIIAKSGLVTLSDGATFEISVSDPISPERFLVRLRKHDHVQLCYGPAQEWAGEPGGNTNGDCWRRRNQNVYLFPGASVEAMTSNTKLPAE